MRNLPLLKLFSMLILMCATAVVFAQPANDDCVSATPLVVGGSASSCVPVTGDTREAVDATGIGPSACSETWLADDVWYSFETPASIPFNGITVEVRLDTTSTTELIENGMAIYSDCDLTSSAILCYTNEPGRRSINIPRTCMVPNTTMFVRVWSAPDPFDNAGTFSICAYEGGGDERVIFAETFDDGLNGWESVSESQSLNILIDEMVDDNWEWSDNACFADRNGLNNVCLNKGANNSPCQAGGDGAVAVQAGFFQSQHDGDATNIGAPPYPRVSTYLVSPPINLSKENCLALTWVESARYLNGGAAVNGEGMPVGTLGAYVQYSLDDGYTWIDPSTSIGTPDVTENYGGEYAAFLETNGLVRTIPLLGAAGNPNVRLRFGFNGDFFYWVIDDIKIIEGTQFDAVAQNNFFARAPINPMSIHMIDSYDFLIDIANLSCQDLAGVNANLTITNAAGDEVHNVDLPYGDIASDFLDENRSFLQPFTPDAAVDTYTASYTVTADRDDDMSNNVRTFESNIVDETVFRKEDGVANGAIGPNPAFFWPNQGEIFNWEIGNMFYAPNGTAITGEPLRFNEITFALANADSLVGDFLSVVLYEISDNNFDNLVDKGDDSELTILGAEGYTVTGTENGFITVAIAPFGNNDLMIKPNTHYLATVENRTTDVRTEAMSLVSDDSYQYSAAIFNAQQAGVAAEDLSLMRYSHAYSIAKQGFLRIGAGNTGDGMTSGNFGDNVVPFVRLGYEIATNVATVDINKNIKIAVSPNPTDSELTLNLSVEEATDMEVSIVDIAGKVLSTRSLNGVTELKEEFNVSDLSNGVYMIHINTKDGVQTKKFVVSK